MNEKLNFESLPDAVSALLNKADVIIGLLSTNVDKSVDYSNIMDKKETLLYLGQRGYKMSISTLYKLTQDKKIPCMKLGNKLRFNSDELDKWLTDKIKSANNISNSSPESFKHLISKTIKK